MEDQEQVEDNAEIQKQKGKIKTVNERECNITHAITKTNQNKRGIEQITE